LLELYGTIDIGSTNCKIGVFNENGHLVYRDNDPLSTQVSNGKEEIDPYRIWKAVSTMCRRLPETIKEQMKAICVIGQGPTIIPVDRSGKPLHRGVTWLDGRGKERIPALIDQGVDPQLAAGLSILEWLQKELTEPAFLLQPADYIVFRLSGKLANMSFPYVGYLPWSEEALEERGWSNAFLVPELIETGRPLSFVNQEAAAGLGLTTQTLITSGAPDFVAALIGTGTVENGFLCDRGGSSQGVTLCSGTKAFPTGLMTTPFFTPGLWKISGIMNTTGIAVEWFCKKVIRQSFELSLEQAADQTTPSKILFLPYLSGERCPHWDNQAKGVFWGLSLDSDAERMTLAVLESVGYAMADAIERMARAGCEIKRIRTTGKQALSSFWNQIKSDILGKPVEVLEIQESELWGGALLSMKAIFEKDLTLLCREKTRVGCTFYPDLQKNALYAELLKIYQNLYAANKALFSQFDKIGKRP